MDEREDAQAKRTKNSINIKLYSADTIYQTGTGRQTMIKLKWEWKINIYGLELEYSFLLWSVISFQK